MKKSNQPELRELSKELAPSQGILTNNKEPHVARIKKQLSKELAPELSNQPWT